MPVLDPPVIVHPLTGAFRPVTPDLLAAAYLAPAPAEADLPALLAGLDAPWSASLAVAPQETAAAVAEALRALALATPGLSPGDVDLAPLDPTSRVARHLAALRALWQAHPEVLPADLRAMAHVLRCGPGDALEPLSLLAAEPCAFAEPAERAVQAALVAHHGLANEAHRADWAARRAPLAAGAAAGSALARVQAGLTGTGAPGLRDDTLAFHAVRDSGEEARLAAAIAQRRIDEGTPPEAVAFLVPDEPGYHAALAAACADLGVPVSGLPAPTDRRDVAGETLLHLLLALQAPAPAMALASLYASPLMPWAPATGDALARAAMQGRFEPEAAKALAGRGGRLFRHLRSAAPDRAEDLRAVLDTAIACLDDSDKARADVASLRARAAALPLGAGPPDWSALLRTAAPGAPVAPPAEATVEGVSVFTEAALPWRPAQHLIALGFAGACWPRPVPASALFLDSELDALRAATGLAIGTRAMRRARRLERLRRQLLAATGTLTVLRPLRAADGGPLPPAPALALIARAIGVEDPDALFDDLRALPPVRWPCAARPVAPFLPADLPAPPATGELRLGRDLLQLRREADGQMRPLARRRWGWPITCSTTGACWWRASTCRRAL